MKHFARYLAIGIFSLFATLASAAGVDINTAGANELSKGIFGVGEARAEAIIAYREEHGPFDSVDELVKVKGIGTKLLEKNRDNMVASQPKE